MNRRRRKANPLTRWLRGEPSVPKRLASKAGSRGRSAARGPLIGCDFASTKVCSRLGPRRIACVLVGGVIAALVIAALRVDLIEQGYARATAMRTEKQLLEERRVLIARLRGLRNPSRLSQWAKKLELSRPKHVITLNSGNPEQQP